MEKEQKINLIKIISAAVLMVIYHFIPATGVAGLLMYLVPYLIVGFDSLKEAGEGILKGDVLDENFLMAIATIGAFILAVIDKSGDFSEAVFVMLFYKVGEFFEDYAVDKSRDNISELMDIRPDVANLVTEDGVSQVHPNRVEVGSIILVSPGEKIPIDGVVCEGASSIDNSSLTGESAVREVGAGDEVLSGSINLSGVLRVKTTKAFGESTVSKILDLVENAQANKSASENFISKFARYYTPTVCALAFVIGVVIPIINKVISGNFEFSVYLYRALTFLVISCPCALVISIPLTFFAGMGGATRAGVLVKGANYLEDLSKIGTVIFDKTGTLTKGIFEVAEVYAEGMEENELVKFAAYAESYSSHPIGMCIKKAYGRNIEPDEVRDVVDVPGEGINATVFGHSVLVGNSRLLSNHNVVFEEYGETGTKVYVAIDGRFAGCIVISDVVKDTSKKAVTLLKNMNSQKVVMLTGDGKKVAETVANRLGIDSYYAQLLPQDKVLKLKEIKNTIKNPDEKVAFVGDGINDAPSLVSADVGIAMGALGSDAAIEAADVVIMDDDPMGLVRAMSVSRKSMRIVYKNIFFAIGIKVICLMLGAFGVANMWMAVFADVGVMVIAVLNALRAFKA